MNLAEDQKTACARTSNYFQHYTLRLCEAKIKKYYIAVKTIEPAFQTVIYLKV